MQITKSIIVSGGVALFSAAALVAAVEPVAAPAEERPLHLVPWPTQITIAKTLLKPGANLAFLTDDQPPARGVDVQLLKDYDPGGGAAPFYNEPQTDWSHLHIENFELDGVRVRIVAPAKPLPGKPWLLERCAADPLQVARALLEKGVYFVGMDADDFGSPQGVARWSALYAELTTKRGFSKKVVLEGYSRSGLVAYNWAAENPEKVACIYGDAPVMNVQSWPGVKEKELLRLYGFKSEAEALAYNQNPVDKARIFAQANVPIIHVCGDRDEVVRYEENTGLFKERYEKAGGRNMTIILKGGVGHHPHGLRDPLPVVEFILRAIQIPPAKPGA